MPRTKPASAPPAPPKSRRKPASGELDPALVKALAHPVRMRVLSRLNEVVASPKELAEEFGVSLPMISYHFRVLVDLGAIELVSETQRRGAIEHHYRALTRAFFTDIDWQKMPVTSRQGISSTVVDQALADLSAAFMAGTFDRRDDRHLSFTPLVVDETGWAELVEVMAGTLERALEIQSESAARMSELGEPVESVRARMTIIGYEGSPDAMSKPVRRRQARDRG